MAIKVMEEIISGYQRYWLYFNTVWQKRNWRIEGKVCLLFSLWLL